MNYKGLTTTVLFCLVLFGGSRLHAQDFEKFRRTSLYTDFKAKTIGDIVTILISESTTGSQESDRSSTGKGNAKASASVTGNLTQFLPIFGAQSNFEHDNAGTAESNQKDALSGRITAVVTEISPNGNLSLKGKRRLAVNGETYILTVAGVARQKDISADNSVLSYNLANVQISYKKDGIMNNLGKPAFLARWSTWLLFAGIGASAALGVGAAAN